MTENSTNKGISVFSWDKFPLECDKFSVCICTKNNPNERESIEIDKLLNYIKLIFPQNCILHTDIVDDKKNMVTGDKNTILFDLRSSDNRHILKGGIVDPTLLPYPFGSEILKSGSSVSDWVDNLYILQKYLSDEIKVYSVTIGEYEKIQKLTLTSTDIIIFDTEETANKYLKERHRSTISNFTEDAYYLLIDKRRLRMDIYGLAKSDLDRYV